MAEASYSNRTFPYFQNSHYRNGNNSLVQPSTNREVCRYFMEGRCRFGDNCWNSHNMRSNNSSLIHSAQRNKSSSRPLTLVNESQHTQSRQPLHPQNRSKCRYPPHETVLTNELCLDFMNGKCTADFKCPYVHGDLCESCWKACLNPFNPEQQEQHTEACRIELGHNPPSIQLSKDKSCGICMDIIVEKEASHERRFGILENCNHVFCFPCIMKWRKVKSRPRDIDNVVDPTVANSCPECRTQSDFITPSRYWFADDEEKKQIIARHRAHLGKKHCPFFKRGKGYCPFGGTCFHQHALPNGRKVNLPLPSGRRTRSHQQSELRANIMSRLLLLDFLDSDDHFMLENLMLLSSGSEFDEEDEDDGLSYVSDDYFTIGSFDI